MMNIIVGITIVLILSGAVAKIVSEKKKGAKCVGCPYSANNKASSNCGCDH